MAAVEFSTFHGDFQDIDSINHLLDQFASSNNCEANLRRMHWSTSWSDLINVASLGSGPDVSHIGETWVSSLRGLNALRPFKPHEIQAMGGEDDFTAAATQGNRLQWSIPWTSFTFVICYRKDVLDSVGADPENAFATLESFQDTLQRLGQSPFEVPWLMPFAPQPYPDLLHIAASWVWGAGGDFIRTEGRTPQVIFHQPKAMQGLTYWLNAYRAIPRNYQQVHARNCAELLSVGRTALIITSIRSAISMLNGFTGRLDAGTRSKIGFAPISNTPWCGGDSLIVWKHTQGSSEREQMALNLVKHLTSEVCMIDFCRKAQAMPTRRKALEEVFPASHPLHDTVVKISQSGRNYQALTQWRPIEHQLASELDNVLFEARTNSSVKTETLLKSHLEPLAERLNRMLNS